MSCHTNEIPKSTIYIFAQRIVIYEHYREKLLHSSEMNITGTLPQEGNVKLFVPSLSTQGSTRPKQNIFNVVLIDRTKLNEKRILRRCKPLIRLKLAA